MNSLLMKRCIVVIFALLLCIFTTKTSFCEDNSSGNLIKTNEMELRAIRERAKMLTVIFSKLADQGERKVYFRTSYVYELNDIIKEMNGLYDKGLPTRISPLPKPIVLFIVPGIEHYSISDLIVKAGQVIIIVDLLLGEQTNIDLKGGKNEVRN